MRIVLVGNSAYSLEQLAAHFERLPSTLLQQLQPDIALATQHTMLLHLSARDVIIIDFSLEAQALQLAQQAKQHMPSCNVLICVNEAHYRRSFKDPRANLNIQRVFTPDSLRHDLAAELLSIVAGKLNSQDRQTLVLGKRYEVFRCLGEGSIAHVYACRDQQIPDRVVAVKVLFPELAANKALAARFRNEIFANYSISHPHVLRAFEYLRDGNLVAYSMEYVAGGNLRTAISRRPGLMPIPEALRMLSQMCAGIQAIHEAGIVHRSLIPENILLTETGDVKITDFGVASSAAEGGYSMREATFKDYLSPEYIMHSQLDQRHDLYALGVIAYQLVTGALPYQSDSIFQTITKRLKSDPPTPQSVRKDCPKALGEFVLKAMAREPAQRFQTAREMAQTLGAFTCGF